MILLWPGKRSRLWVSPWPWSSTAPGWVTDENGFPLQDQDDQYILTETQGAVETWRRPGRIWLRTSRDGGHNWSLPKIKDIGRIGQYEARAQFFAMGQFKHFTCEVNLTDPVDVPLLSEANMRVS